MTFTRPIRGSDSARPHRDRTHWLYGAVVLAVLAGIAVGLLAPASRSN